MDDLLAEILSEVKSTGVKVEALSEKVDERHTMICKRVDRLENAVGKQNFLASVLGALAAGAVLVGKQVFQRGG